ncbi:MAG: hypothetical protein JKY01_14440 [Pseudomonadales bacterium]|nr:hypothetical protein [Pseudomonadales bacterium]
MLICLVLLSGCGFHLRSVGSQFKLINNINIVAGNSFQGFANVLTQTFRKTNINSDAHSPYRLTIEQEKFSKRVAMVTENVRASEYQISLVIIYSFSVEKQGEEGESPPPQTLIHSQRIQLSRSFVYDLSRVGAMQKEEQLIMEEMKQEAAYRILHQVQAVSDTSGLASTITNTQRVDPPSTSQHTMPQQ